MFHDSPISKYCSFFFTPSYQLFIKVKNKECLPRKFSVVLEKIAVNVEVRKKERLGIKVKKTTLQHYEELSSLNWGTYAQTHKMGMDIRVGFHVPGKFSEFSSFCRSKQRSIAR